MFRRVAVRFFSTRNNYDVECEKWFPVQLQSYEDYLKKKLNEKPKNDKHLKHIFPSTIAEKEATCKTKKIK